MARRGLSYHSKGHLTKIASSGTDVYYEDGEKITEKYSLEYNLSWSNGKLTQISMHWKRRWREIYRYSYI